LTAATIDDLPQDVTPSLFRNGEALTYRDREGSDGGSRGVRVETCGIDVCDGRVTQDAGDIDLSRSGFELLSEAIGTDVDFLDHSDVVRHCAVPGLAEDASGRRRIEVRCAVVHGA